MSRKFLDDVRAEVAALINDNIVGDITPADVRVCLNDMIDSLVSDEVAMTSPPSTVLNTTVTPTEFPAVFDAVINSVPGFLIGNVVTGRFELSATPGFSYTFRLFVEAEGQQNDELTFNITRNGVIIGETFEIVTRGPGRATAASAAWFELSAPASATFGVVFSSPNGPGTFTVTNCFMIAVIIPTNNP